MNKNDIINSLNNYLKVADYQFYKDAIKEINKLNDNIYEIPENKYILEAIRINICYNQDKYKIYLINHKIDNVCYRKLTLSKTQLINLMKQLSMIKEDDIHEICNNFKTYDSDSLVIYCVFTINKLKEYQFEYLDNLYDISSVLLGIHEFYFLEHQKSDRLCNYLDYNKESKSAIDNIESYKKVINQLDWIEREKFMIFSGVIITLTGTTYTNDVDILIIASMKDKDYLNKLKEKLNKYDFIDYHILINDQTWYKKNEVLLYQKQWFSYLLPRLGGAQDIWDVFANPEHHFHYFGLKCISINITTQRLLARASPASFVDLLMLKRINNVDIELCVPNLNIRHGKIIITNKERMETIYNSMKKLLKEWHNVDLPISDIKKYIKKCSEINNPTIYTGENIDDPDTSLIKKFHTEIKFDYIGKYAHNADYLLDVGSGTLRDLWAWQKANIKHVIAVEPSKDSIQKAYDRLKKFKPKLQINIIEGFGDDDWSEKNKYDAVIKNKYDMITFNFTIHYMIKNINQVFNNINKVSKLGTKIIVFCLDGEKIFNEMIKNGGKLQVSTAQEPIWGVYTIDQLPKHPMPNLFEVLVYFKGTYGVDKGSIEYLVNVDNLINKFKDNSYSLIEKKNLNDVRNKYYRDLSQIQLQVSKYHIVLVFEKNK